MVEKKRRPTIGTDPLDAVFGGGEAMEGDKREQQPPREQRERLPQRDKREHREQRERKLRFTVHLPESLIEEARNAVVFLSGPPARLTVAALVEAALRKELRRLERDFHGGKAFPLRVGELRGGRPIKITEKHVR